MTAAAVIAAPLAGLQAQALGLAEAMGLAATVWPLEARGVWRHVPPALWPAPLRALGTPVPQVWPGIVIGAGGMAGAVGAALREPGRRVVQVQDPRMAAAKFDVIVVNAHDRLRGPNVVVVRTAIHRATAARLATGAAAWAGRFAGLRRPLVAVLVGGGNGRFVLGAAEAARLGGRLAAMDAGIVLTPSRRTSAEAVAALRAALEPHGAFVWDGVGENPYFGMLALADAIVVTGDSVSMISEAVATSAPVYVARLPGRSRKQAAFLAPLLSAGRIRIYEGSCAPFPAAPLDDTPAAAAEVRRRLGLD